VWFCKLKKNCAPNRRRGVSRIVAPLFANLLFHIVAANGKAKHVRK
jgi:hypothetical protein